MLREREIPVCRPPHPHPRTPTFRMPAGACDTHCHVFGPAARFPFAPDRRYTPPDASKEKLAALHALLGIERAVIVQASCHGSDNSAMLDAIAGSGGRYRGVCNAKGAFSDADFERLHDGGIRGVRFNFVRHLGGAPDLDDMRDLVARVAPLGWHVEWHFDAGNLIDHEDLFEQMPVPVVLDHMGRVPASEGLEQAAFRVLRRLFGRIDNLWIKISGAERITRRGPPYDDAVPFARALVEIAPERIIWGTDWPHPNVSGEMPDDGDLVDLVPRMIDDAAIQRLILVENPERLYGFS